MKRNLFKTYTMESLKKLKENDKYLLDQACMNGMNIQFNVVFLNDKLCIIAFGIKKGSKDDTILKKRGFTTEGA